MEIMNVENGHITVELSAEAAMRIGAACRHVVGGRDFDSAEMMELMMATASAFQCAALAAFDYGTQHQGGEWPSLVAARDKLTKAAVQS